jgi:hypothetical protein
MRTCIYCNKQKPEKEFSDEHIWPRRLGGDFLPHEIWRTEDVCKKCNNDCGLFIDGSFIRSWIGRSQLSCGALEYLAGTCKTAAIPLDYLGPLKNVVVPDGQIAEYWVGPCGAIIVHIHPACKDQQWSAYAGGDPRAKGSNAGRAYIALTSESEFWVLVSLESFRSHFDRAERFVVNFKVPPSWPFKEPDRNDPTQEKDMKTVDAVIDAARRGDRLRVSPAISWDLGSRMLAKLGLAVGHKLLGDSYIQTAHAKNLRSFMREANAEKRGFIPVYGSDFMKNGGLLGAERVLRWPGGWVLMVHIIDGKLGLAVISPAGRTMTVLISDDQYLTSILDEKYKQGVVWITVPMAQEAVGPILLPEYLNYQLNKIPHPSLTALASKRRDRNTLPRCRPSENPTE